MSKYKIGDKFIIEVEEKCVGDFKTEDTTELYRIKGYNSLVFDDNGLDKLQKYEDKDYAEGVKEGLNSLDCEVKKAYEKGLQDAWKLAKKIQRLMTDVRVKLFHGTRLEDIVINFTPQEALAKLEAYEKSQQIEIGDIVRHPNNEHEYLVLDEIAGYAVSTDFKHTAQLSLDSWEKTGKHIDIQSILDGIGKE